MANVKEEQPELTYPDLQRQKYLYEVGELQEYMEKSFNLQNVTVIPSELRGEKDGKQIEFSLREIKILHLFSRHPDELLDRDTIMNECWDMNYFPGSRTLDQHISKLRKKIEDQPDNPGIIETVHGAGYRFRP